MSKLAVISEFVLFLKENKKLWLLPIVITLLLLGRCWFSRRPRRSRLSSIRSFDRRPAGVLC